MEPMYIYISIGTMFLILGMTAFIFWKFDIYKKQSRKLVIIKWGFVLLSIVISQTVFLITVYKQSDYDKVITSKDLPSDPNQAIIESQVNNIYKNQVNIADLYLNENLTAERKKAIFFDLMAPLGALDPIANPQKTPYARQIVNFLFGKYAKQFGISEIDVQPLVEAPLRYASNFDEIQYFKKYKSQLDIFAVTFENDNKLNILSYWATSLYRVNNYFGDADRAFAWEVVQNETPFYEYKDISKESGNATTRNLTIEKYQNLVNQLYDIEIESIYKCDDKIIFIIAGTSNNALGLIYNSTTANEINCGVLGGRFKLIKETKLDNKWRYWVAN